MLKQWAMLTCILFLGSMGTSQAAPPDSPDIVYIDGLPCNRACQSYMAWYRQVSRPRQTAPVSAQPIPSQVAAQPPKADAQRTTRARASRPNSAPPTRAAKKAAPKPIEVPPPKIADLPPADRGEAKTAPAEKITDSRPISNPTSGSDAVTTPPAQVAIVPAAENLTTATAGPAPEQKAESNTKPAAPAEAVPPADAETTALASSNSVPPTGAATDVTPKPIEVPPAETADLRPADRGETKSAPAEKITDSPPISNPTSGSDAGTRPEQVATATAGPAPEQKVESNTKPSGPAEAIPLAGAETSALASPNSAGQLVAILLVRLEIKTVSDLGNKIVAIDASWSESVPSIRNAIVAAGAADVQVSAGETLALARVIDGEVRAAVVSLASPEEAEMWSAGMPGFKILRIPLSPPSGKARRG
jgi:hypothetical protein